MSETTVIRDALEFLDGYREFRPGRDRLQDALAALGRIEQAAKDLDRYLMQPGWALPSDGATECENALVLMERIARSAP